MSKPHLVACTSCCRHVRVSEAACPFCGSVLADSQREGAPPQAPGVRLTRAALFAFGTGTLAVAPGCSSSASVLPPYGLPPILEPIPEGGEGDASVGVDAAYGSPGIGSDAAGSERGDDSPSSVGDAADGRPSVGEAGSDGGHD